MLAASLWRNVHHGSLQQFQESLLHTLTAHVAGDGWIVALAGNLVNLVDEHDTALGSLHIVIGHLEQTGKDTLHVLTHITCLCKHSGIHDGERHIEHLGNGACQQGLTSTRAAHHDDVALLNLHAILVGRLLQALIVVIHRYSQMALSLILSDDILIQIFLDFHRLWHILQNKLAFGSILLVQHASLLHNIVCLLGAILTDVAVDTCNQQLNFRFTSSTEATNFLWHNVSSFTFFFIPYLYIPILYIYLFIYSRITCVPAHCQSYHTP